MVWSRSIHAAQRYNDLPDLMPQHVILVRRLDVQNNTGRLTLDITGCAESVTDRTSFLHPVLCADTSARSPLVLVLVCSLLK